MWGLLLSLCLAFPFSFVYSKETESFLKKPNLIGKNALLKKQTKKIIHVVVE